MKPLLWRANWLPGFVGKDKKLDEDGVIITAYAVLRTGRSIGADPYSAVATYIERMLNQIP